MDRHALYELGVTPLVLVWKDAQCSQYLLDTDSQGNVTAYQQVHPFLFGLILFLICTYNSVSAYQDLYHMY